MTVPVETEDETGTPDGTPQQELRSYLWGYGLSLLLTLPVFGAVAWDWLSQTVLWWAIGVAALGQIAVQFRFFLHIRLKGQAKEDLQLILFTALILGMMGGGTIWILHNLDGRMGGP